MPRRVPSAIPIPTILADRPGRNLFDLELHVVTPMFGGGVNPREVDRERSVTAKAVRGHLRFWWRAMRAHRYPDAERLFEAEAEIWGAPSKEVDKDKPRLPSQSAVEIEVRTTWCGNEVRAEKYVARNGQERFRWPKIDGTVPPAYAMFPYLNEDSLGIDSATFDLRITVAPFVESVDVGELTAEIEAALWAWVMFGGVGARTRRGLGSLWCVDPRFRIDPGLATDRSALLAWLDGRLSELGLRTGQVEPVVRDVPRLLDATMLVPMDGNRSILSILGGWAAANQTMQTFRQGTGDRATDARQPPNPDGPNPNRPRRSRWAEPDSLRRRFGVDMQHAPDRAKQSLYPRIDLGMPVIVQNMSDPEITIAPAGVGRTRMASPIILKTLAFSGNIGVPLALVLRAPHPWDVAGLPIKASYGDNDHTLTGDEMHSVERARQYGPMRGQDSARNAFRVFLIQQCGWREGVLS